MEKATPRKTKYTVTIVPKECLAERIATNVKVVMAPPYDREVDEPAFQRAWEIVKEKRALGLVAPIPPLPAGGIRLRGDRSKQSV